MKATVLMVALLITKSSQAAYEEYRIEFTPEYGIKGSFSINESFRPSQTYLHLAHVNTLRDFIIEYGGEVYEFDNAYTHSVVAPAFDYIIATGPSGHLIDIKGALTLPATLNAFHLGRMARGLFSISSNTVLLLPQRPSQAHIVLKGWFPSPARSGCLDRR